MEHSLPKLVVKNGGNNPIPAGSDPALPKRQLPCKPGGEFTFSRVGSSHDANLTLVSTVGLGGDAVIHHYKVVGELPGYFNSAVEDFIDRLITTFKVQNYQDKENLWLVEIHWKNLAGAHGHKAVSLEPWERMLHGMLSMDTFNYQNYFPINDGAMLEREYQQQRFPDKTP